MYANGMDKLEHYANTEGSIYCIELFSRIHFTAKTTQKCTNVIASWTQLRIIDLFCVA